MTPLSEADWLGEDHAIVRRTRADERSATGTSRVIEHRTVGPPGCGKTTDLSRQATLAAGKYGHDGVLLASLTRAAALEIAGHDTPIPREMIGTLHAHCYRALERPGLAEVPDGLKDWNEHVTQDGLLPTWRMEQKGSASDLDHAPLEAEGNLAGGEGDKLRAQLATLRARQVNPLVYEGETVGYFAEHWNAWKKESGRLDFTDLIEQAIERNVGAPGDPGVIMLDEAQDMSRLEMRLARQWASACEQLVVVSDPAQALYSWRGSDPEALFEGEAASERVLAQSYRVPIRVHAYAVDWIRRMPGHRDFKYQPRAEQGEVRRLTRHPWVEPEGLLDEIERDHAEGRSVMVLGTCAYMLAPLVQILRREGIPFHNPYRPTHGGWNPMRGAERLLAFLRPDTAVWDEQARMWTYDDVRRWMEPLKARGLLARGAKDWIGMKNLEDRFKESRAGEEVGAREAADLFLQEEDAACAFDLDTEWWQRNHLASKLPASQFPMEVYRRRGGRALRERPRIIIGTVHSVKGGEADAVYLWSDLSQAAQVSSWANPADRAPTYRVMYVAMTRARERLTILPPSGSTYVPLPDPATVTGAT